MVNVICDTDFLINLATKQIKNIDTLNVEVGQITFVVPSVVVTELKKLQHNKSKQYNVNKTLEFVKRLKQIPISGVYADKEILEYIKTNGGIVGTLDKELKKKIKQLGGSVVSLSKDRIILES